MLKQKKVIAYELVNPDAKTDQLTAKQQQLLEYIINHNSQVVRTQLIKDGFTNAIISTLCNKGLLKKVNQSQRRTPTALKNKLKAKNHDLTVDQQKALNDINTSVTNKKGETILLHGVTGSGKTEVYLQALEKTIALGMTGIYLVPEISLTPQTIERLVARFGEAVAVLHSGLSDGERYDEWFRILHGKVKIVVGARSAIFAPLEKLGLVIIDEEHETTYKQEEHPRYHTREIAQQISKINGVTLVLGSATPAVETYYHCLQGQYKLAEMPQRITGNLPTVEIIDLRTEFKRGNRNILSSKLRESIQKRIDHKEQVILFLNRRGYSTFVFCRECGFAMRCPNCDVSLTFHMSRNILQCHYCDHHELPPDKCPNCQSHYIKYSGLGTQKLEEEITQLFPGVCIARMDVDTMQAKDASFQMYERLKNKTIDILIGTQMVAKGLDLPNVTLVGIIMADTGLNIPDFRASEKTFQLLTQVAGRAGRGDKSGEVILQTFNPEHYSIKSAAIHNYQLFYQQEICWRKNENYPPFRELLKITVVGLEPNKVKDKALQVARLCLQTAQRLQIDESLYTIMPPNPSLISKKQNKYWWMILLKGKRQLLTQIVLETMKQFKTNKDFYISVDINPTMVL